MILIKFTFYYRRIFINPVTQDFYKVGERYKRTVFANTLRRIAQYGVDEIYKGGETGRKLVDDIKELGGIIDSTDLEDYR